MLERDASCPEAPSRCKLFESCTISEAVSAMLLRSVASLNLWSDCHIVRPSCLSCVSSFPFVSIFSQSGRFSFLFCLLPRTREHTVAYVRDNRPGGGQRIRHLYSILIIIVNLRCPILRIDVVDRMAMRREECFAAIFSKKFSGIDSRIRHFSWRFLRARRFLLWKNFYSQSRENKRMFRSFITRKINRHEGKL